MQQIEQAGGRRPEVFLYRGAWQEWEAHEIDIAVPLSPSDLEPQTRPPSSATNRKKTEPSFPAPTTRANSGNEPKSATATPPTSTTASACPSSLRLKALYAGTGLRSDRSRHPAT